MTTFNPRLLVGTLNLAAALFFCGLALWESIPVRLFPKNEVTFLPHVWCFIYTFAFSVAMSATFDLLGGLVLPWLHKRDYRILPSFFLKWIRGLLLEAGIAIGGATLLMAIGREGGPSGAMIATGFLMGLLITFRGPISSLTGASRSDRAAGIKAPLAVFIWNFGGVILASRYEEVSFLSAAGIVTLGLFVSLWSFLGVLVVPFFLGERNSRIHQLILFPSWVCFGFLSRCLPAVVGLAEYWITGKESHEKD